jgi:hypothetical protein
VHARRSWITVAVTALLGCGEIEPVSIDGAAGGEDAASEDAAVAAFDAAPDADLCSDFAVPAGAFALHGQFCASALGFNPTATPDNMSLACPGAGAAIAGTYGKILRPAAGDQVDGCPATNPFTRMLAPLPSGSIAQMSTAASLTVAAGHRVRARVACPADVANCQAQIQITGRATAAGSLVSILPATLVTATVTNIDVAVPASLVGTTTILNFLVISNGAGTPDLLFENPSLGP